MYKYQLIDLSDRTHDSGQPLRTHPEYIAKINVKEMTIIQHHDVVQVSTDVCVCVCFEQRIRGCYHVHMNQHGCMLAYLSPMPSKKVMTA